MALLLVGCAKEYDDSGLRELIKGLDTRITALESNVQALQSAIGEGVFVAKVQEYADPETGKIIGVTVTYTSGKVAYFEIEPKVDYEGPVLGVITNGAGELVWAVDGIAIKDYDGQDVTVYQTPVFSIDDEGNLCVSIDGEDPIVLGPVTSGGATLEDGIFKDIKVEQDKVVLTLSDDSVVNIPFAEAFKLTIEANATQIVFSELEPIEIPYTVTAKTEGTVVGVAGYNPWMFSVEVQEDKIVITPYSMNSVGVFLIYADSKIGLTSMVSVSIEAEVIEVVDQPYSEDVNYMAEGEDGVVVANVVSNMDFNVKPVDEWIHLVDVKAQVHQLTFSLDNNDTGAVRTGAVQIVKKDDEKVILQTIIIAQLAAEIEEGPANLSKKESANSYLVYAPGEYKFKAVKGNSEESVGTVAKVELLWETYNSAEEVEANSVIADVAFADGFVTFTTPETLKPGSALIAAKDANDEILWSWHIWVPETEIVTDTYSGLFGEGVAAMDRNMGALVAASATAANDEKSYGFFYQWGRKDPFMGADGTTSETKAKTSVAFEEKSGVAITVAESIKHPTQFAYVAETAVDPTWDGQNWNSENISTLWDDAGKKTIYDPCPPGYKVPAYDSASPLMASDGWTYDATNNWFQKSGAIFPFAGYLDDCGGGLNYPGVRGRVWTATEQSEKAAWMLYVRSDKGYQSGQYNKKAGSLAVRCVVFNASAIVPPTPNPDEPGGGDEPGDVAVDLSESGSANCYIVSEAGDYKFAAVKGNSNEAVAAASVELIWETNNTATAPEVNDIIADVSFEDGYVHFSTPETLVPGNALIAAKDGEGVILWSWHIWIPKEEVTSADYASFIGGKMMNMNLGALEAVPATGSATIESLGLLYQWGRKDPFAGAADWADYPTRAAVASSIENFTWEKVKEKTTVDVAIKNPTVYYYDGSDGHDWLATVDETLWGSQKTIYDPCPVGYKVPVNTGAIWTKTDEGWTFDTENHVCEYSNGARIPLAGYIESYGGSLYGSGAGAEHTYLWSATHKDEQAYCMYIRASADSKYYKAYRGKANAGSVRCIAEVVPN